MRRLCAFPCLSWRLLGAFFLWALLGQTVVSAETINGDLVISGSINYAIATGAANTYAITLPRWPGTTYRDGSCFAFRANAANTGSATLNVAGMGAKTLQKRVAGVLTNLAANDIGLNQPVLACYQSVNGVLELQSGVGGGGGGGGSGTVTNVATASPLNGGPIVSTGTVSCPTCTTNASPLTANLPVLGAGGQSTSIGSRTGTTTQFATFTGPLTANKQLTLDASGNVIASGIDVGGTGGSGSVTSVATTAPLTGGTIVTTGTVSCPTCTTNASPLTANLPLIGGGAQAAVAATKSGTTTQFATVTGALTTGQQLAFDGSGNIIASGTAIGAGGGGAGDITDVGTCTTGACFTDTTPSTRLTFTPTTTPAIPTAGKATGYVNSTDKVWSLEDDAGVVTHTIRSCTVAAQQWLVGITDAGVCQRAQPAFSDLSGTVTDAQLPTTLANHRINPRALALTDAASVTPNSDTTDLGYMLSLSQATTLVNPTGTPVDGQFLRLRILSSVARALTWGTAYSANMGLPLPTATTGGNSYDEFGFQWNAGASKWDLVATTQFSATARRRTCMIYRGDDAASAPILADADLGPLLQVCMVPSNATVEEITVYSDAGTPNVLVHRRTGTTNTALLSAALAAAGNGAPTCARATAQAGYAGVTCAATLQNVTIGAGDTLGLTSGTAGGVAKRMTIAISFLLNS